MRPQDAHEAAAARAQTQIDNDAAVPQDVPDPARPADSGSPARKERPRAPRGEVTAALASVIGGGLVGVALLFGGGDAPADADAAKVEAAGVIPSSSAPSTTPGRWSYGTHSRWKSARPKDLVLELPADNRIAVWMNHVRPMLVVRCMNRKPEVFVFTETAARIEPQDENHTVRLSFDGQPAAVERWPDSVEHDALFAPDGDAFLRKLVAAKTLSFGFSPHNAMPVEVRFNVSGLEELVRPAAKQCGW